jgi:hypothetical protein
VQLKESGLYYDGDGDKIAVSETHGDLIRAGLIPRRMRRIVGWALAHQVDGINADLH